MNATPIEQLVAAQRQFFASGRTLDLAFRKQSLVSLKKAILAHEAEINAALMADLGKSATETYMCETGMTLSELSYMLRHLERFAKKRRVLTPLAQFPSSSFTVREPYGVALIMAPWKYPFMLLMEPLIGALAAGNCCILKPSAYAPATSKVMAQIVAACFPPEYVALVEGGRAENQALLHQRFDYIFFTGGVTVGKEVMEKAAKSCAPPAKPSPPLRWNWAAKALASSMKPRTCASPRAVWRSASCSTAAKPASRRIICSSAARSRMRFFPCSNARFSAWSAKTRSTATAMCT